MIRSALAIPAGLAVVLVLAGSSSAAFHGANGLIAFTLAPGGTSLVYTEAVDGHGPKLVKTARLGRALTTPAWSPNGTSIAAEITDNGSGTRDIATMLLDGQHLTNLTNGIGANSDPSWSPDGSKLAFVSTRDGSGGDVFVMRSDGTGTRQVTHGFGPATHPVWSPDGTKIVFASVTGASDGSDDIYVVSAKGGKPVDITTDDAPFGGAAVFTNPSWSPDGTRLAVAVAVGGTDSDIWTMRADGSGAANVTKSAQLAESAPSWSPDGSSIVYAASTRPSYTNPGLYTIPVGGGEAQRLSIRGSDNNPPASPDWQATPAADLSAYVQSPRPAAAKNGAAFVVTVTNQGPDPAIRLAIVTIMAPKALATHLGAGVSSDVRLPAGCTLRAGVKISCELELLAPHASTTFTFLAKPSEQGSLSLHTTASSMIDDPKPGNDVSTAVVRIG